ncbi:energy-coupling factor transporter transmembrane protein EcfT [Bacillus timonensis]|nr:energy-coupling factor transporter transmembrane protein EcfT [Bacillus timonensis]
MNIMIGRYVPGDSFIHKMDPRAKLLLVFLYVFVIFLANSYVGYIIMSAVTIMFMVLTKISLSFYLKGLKPILWVVVFTFILHLLMTKEGEVVFEVGPIQIFSEGIQQGIFISLRLLLLIIMTTMLTLTTTPIEVTDGIESLLGPFKRVGLPVHELALMMSISLRFIPTLMQETEKIMKAQTARGLDFTTGPINERVKAVVPLLIPLFISAFKRAEDLAIAMEARGYRGGEGRTKYRLLEWKHSDSAMLVLLGVTALILWIIRQ